MSRFRPLRSNGGVPPAPPVAVGERVVFAQPAPDAVVEEAEAPPSTSDGRVRCARRKGSWQCAHLFVPEVNRFGKLQTRCERCRATRTRYEAGEAGKARAKRYDTGDKRKATAIRFVRSEKGKAVRKRYRAGETGKTNKKRYKEGEAGQAAKKRYKEGEAGKACAKRFKTSDKGKACAKRFDTSEVGKKCRKRAKTSEAGLARRRAVCESMRHKLSQKIGKMCRNGNIESISALQATGCASAKELRAHFESTFEPWMTWSNRGVHKAGGNSGRWQTGHRLACAFYDDGNPADIKRCWNKANLFAQDADENHRLKVKMPDDAVLERLCALDLLPCAWNGIVPPAAQRAEMERTASLRVDYR